MEYKRNTPCSGCSAAGPLGCIERAASSIAEEDSVDAEGSVDAHCAVLYLNVSVWAMQRFVAFHHSAICTGQIIAVLLALSWLLL